MKSVDADNQSSLDLSTQLSAQAPASASSSSSQPSFVTAEQFEAMNNKWSEQFAHFEAFLSRGNVLLSLRLWFLLPLLTQ